MLQLPARAMFGVEFKVNSSVKLSAKLNLLCWAVGEYVAGKGTCLVMRHKAKHAAEAQMPARAKTCVKLCVKSRVRVEHGIKHEVICELKRVAHCEDTQC